MREERGDGGLNVIWVQHNGAKTWTFLLPAVFLQSEDCVDEYFVHTHGCLSQVFALSHKYPVIKIIIRMSLPLHG